MEKRNEAAMNTLCGALLGEGIHRKVFACRLDESLVVKVENDEEYRSFANVFEWQNWTDHQFNQSVAKWLAPCTMISPCGLVLIQKRVQPLRESERPEKLPAFLTDVKDANFGLFEGRVVASDYSTIIANASTRLRKAEWF